MTSTICHTLDWTTGRIRQVVGERPAQADRHVYGDYDQITGYRWDVPTDVDPAVARTAIRRHFDDRLVQWAADWHNPLERAARAEHSGEPDLVEVDLAEAWAGVAAELSAVNAA